MTMISVLAIDGKHVAHGLQQASEKLDTANGELVLDFSGVQRIDPGAISAMEKLAAVADAKGTKVVLRGLNVDVYKVLKLVRLAPRFAFLTEEKPAH